MNRLCVVSFTLASFIVSQGAWAQTTAGLTRGGGGASPVVDAQNVHTQQVLKLDVLEALPSGARDLTQLASLTLGATASTPGRNDVGGALSENNTGVSIHGGRGDDGKVNYDGMNTNNFYGNGGGQMRSWRVN